MSTTAGLLLIGGLVGFFFLGFWMGWKGGRTVESIEQTSQRLAESTNRMNERTTKALGDLHDTREFIEERLGGVCPICTEAVMEREGCSREEAERIVRQFPRRGREAAAARGRP